MKRFEFSLDRLLKVRKQLERLAELEQSRARDVVDRARANLLELERQLADISARFTAAVGSAMPPSQWASSADMAERLGKSIRQAEQEVEAAEQKLLAASQERAQLATEVEALDTLRRQQWEKWRQEAQKTDQDRLDELGIRRWQESRGGAVGGPQAPQ